MQKTWIDEGPKDAKQKIILAHGAGATMDSEFMNLTARYLVNQEFRVVRFEFPYMMKRRLEGTRRPPDRMPVLIEHWRSVVEELGDASGWLIGGKSMGGRVASMVADDLGVRGLICLGYPLHPPGKPLKLRIDHLLNIRTSRLIVQGQRDPFGTQAEFEALSLSSNIRYHWVKTGDHSLKPLKSSGYTAEQMIEDAMQAVVKYSQSL